jgi:hypothetical protein
MSVAAAYFLQLLQTETPPTEVKPLPAADGLIAYPLEGKQAAGSYSWDVTDEDGLPLFPQTSLQMSGRVPEGMASCFEMNQSLCATIAAQKQYKARQASTNEELRAELAEVCYAHSFVV